MSETKNMQVIDKVSASSALASFLIERNEYEHKHQLSHNDRNYEVRKKFKTAGILPEYTNDKALGDFQITPSSDLDLVANKSLAKINKRLKDYNKTLKKGTGAKGESLIERIRKVEYTPSESCGCFDCQSQADETKLKVNPAKKDKKD